MYGSFYYSQLHDLSGCMCRVVGIICCVLFCACTCPRTRRTRAVMMRPVLRCLSVKRVPRRRRASVSDFAPSPYNQQRTTYNIQTAPHANNLCDGIAAFHIYILCLAHREAFHFVFVCYGTQRYTHAHTQRYTNMNI